MKSPLKCREFFFFFFFSRPSIDLRALNYSDDNNVRTHQVLGVFKEVLIIN